MFNPELLRFTPDNFLIASNGRGARTQGLLESLGQPGILVSPDGLSPMLNQGGEIGRRAETLVASIDQRHQDLILVNEPDLNRCGFRDIRDVSGVGVQNTAYKVLRAFAHYYCHNPKGACQQPIAVVARDTIQALAVPEFPTTTFFYIQERPNNPVDRAREAHKLSQADFVLLVTNMIFAGISFPDNYLPENIALAINYIMGTKNFWDPMSAFPVKINQFSRPEFSLFIRSLTSFIAVKFNGKNAFPDDAFSNAPGGLDFGHPAVTENMLCLTNGNKATFGSEDLPVGFGVEAKQIKTLGNFVPYNDLSEEEREAIQNVRCGAVPPLEMERALSELQAFKLFSADYFAEFPRFSALFAVNPFLRDLFKIRR